MNGLFLGTGREWKVDFYYSDLASSLKVLNPFRKCVGRDIAQLVMYLSSTQKDPGIDVHHHKNRVGLCSTWEVEARDQKVIVIFGCLESLRPA